MLWQDRYEQGRTGWDRGMPSGKLKEWLESGQLASCRILVPGCGNGHEVLELAAQGFDVTGIDFAASPIASLKSKLSENELLATILEADVFQFQPDPPVDAVYDQTFLCAIDPKLRESYVQQLHRWLQPDGKLFALFMQCKDLGKPGPPFHCDIEEMQRLFSPEKWVWPELPPQRVNHPSGLFELAVILTKR